MPQRFNGIGTTYLGSSNVLARPGDCDACGRGVSLRSYDTRTWFTFFFIPIIPLGRKRVIDQCPSCTSHRALDLKEWGEIRTKAVGEAARKAVAAPSDPDAQIELHRVCLVMGEWEKADAFRRKLEEDFARNAKVQLYLASAHAYRGEGPQAEAALARARAIDPDVAPPEPPEPPPGPPPMRSRRPLVLAVVVGTVVAVLFSFASVVKAGSRRLYIVSGYEQPLSVELDDRPAVTVRAGDFMSLEVPEGRHRARIRGPITQELDFVMESNFFLRLFDDRVFVLNPGGAGMLVLQETGYSARTVSPSDLAPDRLYFGEPFAAIDGVDYPFAPFPPSITTKERGIIRKKRLGQITTGPGNVVYWLLGQQRSDDALAVAEWAVRCRSQDRELTIPLYLRLAKPEQSTALLRERIALRPVDVESHRAWQALNDKDADGLRKLYDGELAKTPGDADLLYLRGRLGRKISESRGWFEKALAADPEHAWSHYALAYGFASEGDWPAAKSSLERAAAARPSASFQEALRRARLAAGDFEPLLKEAREEVGRTPWLFTANSALARALVASGKAAEAKALLLPFKQALQNAEDPNPTTHALNLEREILYAASEFAALAALPKEDSEKTAGVRARALLELGKVDEAVRERDPDDLLFALALALVRPEDGKLREAAAAALDAAGDDAAPLAKALRSGSEADLPAVLDAAVDAELKAVALAALARRIPARAAELRERAARLNRLWTFPYHLVGRSLKEK